MKRSSSINLPKRTFKDYFTPKMTPGNIVHWEVERKKGVFRFILLQWLFFWGLMFGLTTVIDFLRYGSFKEGEFLFDNLKTFGVISFIIGTISWYSQESRFRKFKANQEYDQSV